MDAADQGWAAAKNAAGSSRWPHIHDFWMGLMIMGMRMDYRKIPLFHIFPYHPHNRYFLWGLFLLIISLSYVSFWLHRKLRHLGGSASWPACWRREVVTICYNASRWLVYCWCHLSISGTSDWVRRRMMESSCYWWIIDHQWLWWP